MTRLTYKDKSGRSLVYVTQKQVDYIHKYENRLLSKMDEEQKNAYSNTIRPTCSHKNGPKLKITMTKGKDDDESIIDFFLVYTNNCIISKLAQLFRKRCKRTGIIKAANTNQRSVDRKIIMYFN